MNDSMYRNRINLITLPNPTNAVGLMFAINEYAKQYDITDMYKIFVESDSHFIYIHQGICNPVCEKIMTELAVISRKKVKGTSTAEDDARYDEIKQIIKDNKN